MSGLDIETNPFLFAGNILLIAAEDYQSAFLTFEIIALNTTCKKT